MPTPLANSWSCWLPSKTVGMPTITIVPSTAPVTDESPPTTETASTRSDSLGREVVGKLVVWPAANRPPASAATPPESANAISFARVGDTVYAAALVSLSRTASSDRPMPVRRKCVTTQDHEQRDAEAEVVVALLVGRRSPTARPSVVAGARLNPVNEC